MVISSQLCRENVGQYMLQAPPVVSSDRDWQKLTTSRSHVYAFRQRSAAEEILNHYTALRSLAEGLSGKSYAC